MVVGLRWSVDGHAGVTLSRLQHLNLSPSSHRKATSVCPIGHLDVAFMISKGGALPVQLYLLEPDTPGSCNRN
jgi:hypothetical protein